MEIIISYGGAVGDDYVAGSRWLLQSFTVNSEFTSNEISLYLLHTGSGSGDATLNIYAAINPNGNAIFTDTIHATSSPSWVNINIESAGKFIKDDVYCIELKYPGGSYDTDYIHWYPSAVNSGGAYRWISTNSGGSWGGGLSPENTMTVRGVYSLLSCSAVSSVTVEDTEPAVAEQSPVAEPSPAGSSRRIACLGDMSHHGGAIITSNADGTLHAAGTDVAVDGANHACPLMGHGITPVSAIVNKTKHNGKLVLTQDAIAGCGAKIIPPDRAVYVE